MRLTRWTDKANSLYVVLERRAVIKVDGNDITLVPTVISLLDVFNERELEISVAVFEQKIQSGEIRQILKPIKS